MQIWWEKEISPKEHTYFQKVTDPGTKIHFKSQRLIPPSLKKENLSKLALRYVIALGGKLAVDKRAYDNAKQWIMLYLLLKRKE